MKELRIYYNLDGKIIYHIALSGEGIFPRSIEQELQKLPLKTSVLVIDDKLLIGDYYGREGNKIVDGKLVLGTKPTETSSEPVPIRDLAAEIDQLKIEVQALKTATATK